MMTAGSTPVPRLAATDIRVNFGGVRAVDGVDLSVAADSLLGVVGPNGSGKSTVLNALCGVVSATGKVTIDGQVMPLGSPERASRAGIARLYQAPQPFAGLSVIENVLVGSSRAHRRGVTAALVRRRQMMAEEKRRWNDAHNALDIVGLADRAQAPVEMLSYGQLRMLDLARAVVSEPTVLLLDEPTAGLNDAESAQFVETLGAVRDQFHPAVVLVDHKISIIDSLSDSVLVIDEGQRVLEGPPEEIWTDVRVRRAYLGERIEADHDA